MFYSYRSTAVHHHETVDSTSLPPLDRRMAVVIAIIMFVALFVGTMGALAMAI
jgi:hypothetical protein